MTDQLPISYVIGVETFRVRSLLLEFAALLRTCNGDFVLGVWTVWGRATPSVS